MRLSLYVEYASRIDYTNEQLGDVLTTQSQAVWDINNHWQLDVRHNYSHLDDYQGRRVFTANLVDFRLYYKFSMRAMLKLILQFEDIDRNEDAYFYQVSEINKDYGSQLVYSYKINAQTLFYLGYSDKGYQDDSLKALSVTNVLSLLKSVMRGSYNAINTIKAKILLGNKKHATG